MIYLTKNIYTTSDKIRLSVALDVRGLNESDEGLK